MPYIDQRQRDILDPRIDSLSSAILNVTEFEDPEIIGGVLNYVVTRLMANTRPRRYKDFERLVGMLECCKAELYRRKVAPYEDEKIASNGDVY